MNLKKYILGIAMPLALGLASCTEFRDAGELDDQLYLQKSGLAEATIFNWGTYTYKLPVIKSGKGNHAATVRLTVDETVIDEYKASNPENTIEYLMLPENCYTLTESSLSFAVEEYRKYFLIDFDAEALAAAEEALATSNPEAKYVLPCRMTTANTDIQISEEEMSKVLILPSVSQPYIGFETPVIYEVGSSFSIKTDDDDLTKIYPIVEVNYYNDWNITYEVAVNPTVLEEYKATHPEDTTDYVLLPEDAYEINESSCLLRPNRDYEYLQITLKEEAFWLEDENYAFGNYALPLEITSVSQYGIDPAAKTTVYPVTIQPPVLETASSWIVPDTLVGGIDGCVSEITDEATYAPYESYQCEAAIDDAPNTFWVTSMTPTGFPYYVTIDFQENCKLYRLAVSVPTEDANASVDNATLKAQAATVAPYMKNAKAGRFEVSMDGVNWTTAANWERSSEEDDTTVVINIDKHDARYLRLVITDAFNYAVPGDQSSGAVCAISKIDVWGI